MVPSQFTYPQGKLRKCGAASMLIEHLRAFPKDALSMPGHMDLVIKMKRTGMQWQKYDMLVSQKRGKKIARGSKKVGSWATTDVILYLECQ